MEFSVSITRTCALWMIPTRVPTSPALCLQQSLLESSYSVTSLSCSMPCSGVLSRSLGGQRSVHIQLPLNIEAGVRLFLVLFKRSTCSKHVEVYLQSLVTTTVFLGLQTFHLARAPRKRTKATSHTYSEEEEEEEEEERRKRRRKKNILAVWRLSGFGTFAMLFSSS